MAPDRFKAFRIHNDADGYHAGFEDLRLDDLGPGAVTVRVAWSSVNYKDALAATGKGKILRRFPLVGGNLFYRIDADVSLAGGPF